LDNSLESVKMKLELLRMGSVEDIGRMDLVEDKPPREEKNKEDRENKQSQMSLSLKVDFTLLLLDIQNILHA
jgi:hypothetical protein